MDDSDAREPIRTTAGLRVDVPEGGVAAVVQTAIVRLDSEPYVLDERLRRRRVVGRIVDGPRSTIGRG
jgi:hypothetical protein